MYASYTYIVVSFHNKIFQVIEKKTENENSRLRSFYVILLNRYFCFKFFFCSTRLRVSDDSSCDGLRLVVRLEFFGGWFGAFDVVDGVVFAFFRLGSLRPRRRGLRGHVLDTILKILYQLVR